MEHNEEGDEYEEKRVDESPPNIMIFFPDPNINHMEPTPECRVGSSGLTGS